MTAEENKKLVLDLYNGPPNEKGMVFIDPVVDALAEGAMWWHVGTRGDANGGWETRQQVAAAHKDIGRFFRKWEPVVDRVIAEGDYVVVQLRATGETYIGRPYDQRYVFIIELRDGKIKRFWEYTDTFHAKQAFGLVEAIPTGMPGAGAAGTSS